MIIVEENNVYSEYYTYSDHLGSVNVVTDDSGTVVARQSFDAWGRKRNATDWTYDNVDDYDLSWLHRGYTGHEMLPEFGLINMNGRLYDNYLGRMLSPDEFSGQDGTSQSFNRYTYAFNNPLKYSDPDGENPIIGPSVHNAIMSQGYILPTVVIKETIFKTIIQESVKTVAPFAFGSALNAIRASNGKPYWTIKGGPETQYLTSNEMYAATYGTNTQLDIDI